MSGKINGINLETPVAVVFDSETNRIFAVRNSPLHRTRRRLTSTDITEAVIRAATAFVMNSASRGEVVQLLTKEAVVTLHVTAEPTVKTESEAVPGVPA